jgi:hypothetical protein
MVDGSQIDGRCIRKDGSVAALKKDGTPRIVGGGYYAEKQERWGRGVLKRATDKAKKYFPRYQVLAVVAEYAEVSGYEGVKHLFQKKYTYARWKRLRNMFLIYAQKDHFMVVFREFQEAMFEANSAVFVAEILKRRRKKPLTKIN